MLVSVGQRALLRTGLILIGITAVVAPIWTLNVSGFIVGKTLTDRRHVWQREPAA
jgi:hypothetical protein